MKRAFAFLILSPCLLWYWAFWGCIFIVGMLWQLLFVTVTWLARLADGKEETFCGVWNLQWDGSFPTHAWQVFKSPLKL